MSLNTKRVKKMSFLIHFLGIIPWCPNLILKSLVWKQLKCNRCVAELQGGKNLEQICPS
jgi:hypothetical protein